MILFHLLLPCFIVNSNVKFFRLQTRKLSSKISLSSKTSRYYPNSPFAHKNTISDPASFNSLPIGDKWEEIMLIFSKYMKDYFLSTSPKLVTEGTVTDLKAKSKLIYKDINKLLFIIQNNFSKTPGDNAILPVRYPVVFQRHGLLLDLFISLKVKSDIERIPYRELLTTAIRENEMFRALFLVMYKESFWIVKTRYKMDYDCLNNQIIKATKKFNDVSSANENYNEIIKMNNSIQNILSNKTFFSYTEADLNTQDTETSYPDLNRSKSFDVYVVYSRIKTLKISLLKSIEEFKESLKDIEETYNGQISNLVDVDLIDTFLNDETYSAIKQAVAKNTPSYLDVYNSLNKVAVIRYTDYSFENGKETEKNIKSFLVNYKKKTKELINNFRLFYKKLLRVYYLMEIQDLMISDGFVIKQKLKEMIRFKRM